VAEGTYWQEFRAFARTFIRHPLMIGAIFPSSPFLVEHVLDEVDFDSATVIVEYGQRSYSRSRRMPNSCGSCRLDSQTPGCILFMALRRT
jgi:hypothetical protein